MILGILLLALAAEPPADGVQLDLAEPVELKVLVDYVARATGTNIVYDEGLLKKKVSLRAPAPVAKSALPGLLKGVLQSNGLALVPADQPGWQKVIPAERLAAESGPLRREVPGNESDADPVACVLTLQFADPARVASTLTPALSKPGGALVVLPENRTLVIQDFGRNVQRLVELARLMDRPSLEAGLEIISLQHQEAADLIPTLERLLGVVGTASPSGGGGVAGGLSSTAGPTLAVEPATGRLLVQGTPEQIARVKSLVERLDVAVSKSTEVYRPRYLSAARLRGLLEQGVAAGTFRAITDEATNTLIVTAPEAVHGRIAALVRQFDSAPPESVAAMRFYKMMERRADDVFVTLAGLLGAPDSGGGPGGGTGVNGGLADMATPVAINERPGAPRDNPNQLGGAAKSGAALSGSRSLVGGARDTGNFGSGPPSDFGRNPYGSASGPELGARAPARAAAIQGANFSIALDEHTNSLIVIATPELHQQIERLIQKLDRRRPQVLVEVTLVSLSTDTSLNLGTELQALDLGDAVDYLAFSSFGLSTVDPRTGARTLIPGAGGNGVILTPQRVPVILRALATKGKTHVYSAPRILVDDNASGSIESVAESPFTSVNASNTVATTSFAGFAKAGTQLQIEPHIAEGDHLELRYTLTVSAFTGAGSATVPPPRSSDTINSTVRVPDGHTVIVGGLLSETVAESSSHLPWIGELPVANVIFGNQTRSKSKVRLYAFITPSVLRHNQFEDLRYLSEKDLRSAKLPSNEPPVRVQYMEAGQ